MHEAGSVRVCFSLDTDGRYSSIKYLWIAYASEDTVLGPVGGLEMLADCFTEGIEGNLEDLAVPSVPLWVLKR